MSVHADFYYIINSPKVFVPGTIHPVSVLFNDLAGSCASSKPTIALELRLHYSSNVLVSYLNNVTIEVGVPKLVYIDIPSVVPQEDIFTLSVSLCGSRLSRELQLAAFRRPLNVYVQTDKPLYKPGQTVRTRLFGLYPNLTATDRPITYEVYDPMDNLVLRERNQQMEASGVYHLNISLSSRPPLGHWKIKATIMVSHILLLTNLKSS